MPKVVSLGLKTLCGYQMGHGWARIIPGSRGPGLALWDHGVALGCAMRGQFLGGTPMSRVISLGLKTMGGYQLRHGRAFFSGGRVPGLAL